MNFEDRSGYPLEVCTLLSSLTVSQWLTLLL